MTRKKKAAGAVRAKPKAFRKASGPSRQSTASRPLFPIEDLGHFSLLEEARNTERHHSTWTPESKFRYSKINFVTAGLQNPTEENNGIMETGVHNREAQEEMERLSRLSASAAPFVPQTTFQTVGHAAFQATPQSSSPRGNSLPIIQVEDHSLFIVDTQGHQPAFQQRPSPKIRSPSPTSSESSDEEVVFSGRRPAGHTIVEDHRPVPLQSSVPSEVVTTNSKPSWDDTPVQWEHRSKPAIGWSVPRVKPRITEDPPMLTYRLKEDEDRDEDDDNDDERAIVQDYIDNMGQKESSSTTFGVFQCRELDLQLKSGPVKTGKGPTTVSTISLNGFSASEDKKGSRINVPKGKGRMTIESERDDDEDEDEDEDEDDEDEDNDSILDNADLVQRRQDGFDDELLAGLLAKQDKLGISSDDLLLLGDDGVTEVHVQAKIMREAARYNKNKPKKARRSDGSFPSANLVADVLEQDPYDGFDIMDFERPSLRLKNKAKKAQPPLDVSDSDLQAVLESSWQTDRDRKRARKAEREILRMQGLLGKKNKGQTDLSEVFLEGLNIDQMGQVFHDFLDSSHQERALPPMDKLRRKMIHELASVFNMTSKSKGSKQNRFPILIKTTRTIPWSSVLFYSRAGQVNRGFFPRLDAQSRPKGVKSQMPHRSGGNAPGTKYRDGDVVGAAAPELGVENRGRAMLEKMGWSAGSGLGAGNNKGILQPIAHVVKNSRAGLG